MFLVLFSVAHTLAASESQDAYSNLTRDHFKSQLVLVQKDDPSQSFDPATNITEYAFSFIRKYESAPEKYSGRALLFTALAYGSVGRLESAGTVLNKFLQKNPEDPLALTLLGLSYEGRAMFPDATRNYKRAWDKQYAPALALLGACYFRTKATNEINALLPVMIKHLDDVDVRIGLVMYSQLAEPPNPELFRRVAEGVSDDKIVTAYELVAPYYALGFWNVGERERALRIMALLNKRDAYGVFKYSPTKRKEVLAAFEANPSLFTNIDLTFLGACYMLEDQPAKAKPLYIKYLQIKPNDGPIWCNLGFANQKLSNYEEAISDHRKALSLGYSDGIRLLAGCYIVTGALDKVREMLPDLIARQNADPDVVGVLIAYSIVTRPVDKALFLSTVKAATDDTLIDDDNIEKIIEHLEMFGEKERAAILRAKVKQRRETL